MVVRLYSHMFFPRRRYVTNAKTSKKNGREFSQRCPTRRTTIAKAMLFKDGPPNQYIQLCRHCQLPVTKMSLRYNLPRLNPIPVSHNFLRKTKTPVSKANRKYKFLRLRALITEWASETWFRRLANSTKRCRMTRRISSLGLKIRLQTRVSHFLRRENEEGENQTNNYVMNKNKSYRI